MTNTSSNGRLADIASRQKASRARDFVFAAFVALATIISVSTVSAAATAGAQIAQR